MHQSWILSCLGSLGKRKKKIEGKVKATYAKIIKPLNNGNLIDLPSTLFDAPEIPSAESKPDKLETKANVNVPKKRKKKRCKTSTKRLNAPKRKTKITIKQTQLPK